MGTSIDTTSGLLCPGGGERLVAVTRLGKDGDVSLGVKHQAEPFAHELLVVRDDDADHPATSSGSRARTANPPCGSGPTSSSPPKSATRSRIPVRPCPELGRSDARSPSFHGRLVVRPGDLHARICRPRVLEHVRQRFLNDAVDRDLDGRRREGRTVPIDAEVDAEARGADAIRERVALEHPAVRCDRDEAPKEKLEGDLLAQPGERQPSAGRFALQPVVERLPERRSGAGNGTDSDAPSSASASTVLASSSMP